MLLVCYWNIISDVTYYNTKLHLKKLPTSMGPVLATDYVRLAVRDMPYAENAGIILRSPWGLVKMMRVIVGVRRVFALTVSE